MAGCKMCGYFVPDDAKKCAHCGTDFYITLRQHMWKCMSAFTNMGAILASLATCVMAGVMISQTRSMENQAVSLEAQTQALKKQASSIEAQTNILQKNFELQYIPIVKVGAVAFNFVRYRESPTSESVAMYFTIPIENKHGFAYNVKIIKKELTILRGKFDLDIPSLQSALTQRAFELSPGQIKYDTIGIDENVPNFERMQSGGTAFILEYTIEYEAMSEVKAGPYVYHYVIQFKGGRQDVIEEATTTKKGTP